MLFKSRLKELKKTTFLTIIIFFSLVSFVLSLFVFATLFSQNLRTKELISQIEKAYKFSSLHEEISFERAFNILSANKAFGIFSQNCQPFYISDLALNQNQCNSLDPEYIWTDIVISERRFKIGERKDLGIMEFFNENYETLQIMTMAFFIFAIFFGTLSFYIFITMPSLVIVNELDTFLESKQLEQLRFPQSNDLVFGKLYQGINKLISRISDFKEKSAKLELSRQVVHDLRSPIAMLEDQILSSFKIDPEILSLGIKRIQQISDGLLGDSYNETPIYLKGLNKELHSLATSFQININEKVNFDVGYFLRSKISDQKLYRFMSNILKNSKEAKAQNLWIDYSLVQNSLRITIIDDGEGVSDSKLNLLKLNSFTDKSGGSGLGLSYIRNNLEEVGGELILQNGNNNGLQLTLNIPISLNPSLIKRMILIDDDKYIGLGWKKNAELKNIPFIFLETFEAVNLKWNDFEPDDTFFLDLNLKGKNGLEIAERLYKNGFTKLYLATGYDSTSITIPAYIIECVGKKFPF